MKHTDLVRHLEKHNCVLLREGARHSIYLNPAIQRQVLFLVTGK